MKKILTLLVCLITMQFTANASDDRPITFNQLPAKSQELVKKHFANEPIALVKMDTDFFDKSYDVAFTNGNKIEFDKNGNWKEVDCRHSQLPTSLVPAQIQKYVSTHYSGAQIIRMEKESRNRYEVNLSNGLELTFDSRFNLVDIDD